MDTFSQDECDDNKKIRNNDVAVADTKIRGITGVIFSCAIDDADSFGQHRADDVSALDVIGMKVCKISFDIGIVNAGKNELNQSGPRDQSKSVAVDDALLHLLFLCVQSSYIDKGTMENVTDGKDNGDNESSNSIGRAL